MPATTSKDAIVATAAATAGTVVLCSCQIWRLGCPVSVLASVSLGSTGSLDEKR
ncbi:hypothetical protein BGZ92_006278, partial [Podila epicladia]